MVCYLENDNKGNSNHMFSIDAVISLNILCPTLVESTGTASLDTERELYLTSKHQKKLMAIFTKHCSKIHTNMTNKCLPRSIPEMKPSKSFGSLPSVHFFP